MIHDMGYEVVDHSVCVYKLPAYRSNTQPAFKRRRPTDMPHKESWARGEADG